MKKSFMTLLLTGTCLLGALMAGGAVNYTVPGFTIDTLEAPPGNQQRLILQMFLPPTDSFAPNVNVMFIPTTGNFDTFLQSNRAQLARMNLTEVHFENHGDGTANLEYAGTMQGRALHFRARLAVAKAGVYVATGTTLESQWKDVGDPISKNVDSLKVGQQ